MMQLMMMEYSIMCYTWNDLGTYIAGLHKVCNETISRCRLHEHGFILVVIFQLQLTVSVLKYFFGFNAIGILYLGSLCVCGHYTECLLTR